MTEDTRPPFARDFPDDPELAKLVEAFERGDYRAVRQGTASLEKRDDEAIRNAARALRSRTETDPVAKVVLVLTFALLAWLTFYWERHDGKRNVEPDAPPPAASAR